MFIFSSQKFKSFSTFIRTLSRAIAVTFAVCSATEKLARIFSLFFITSRMEDSFLPYNLAFAAYDFFFFYFIVPRIFTFSLMERTPRLLLGLEALSASLLLRFGSIITVNVGFLNTNNAIMRQLIWTARTLEANSRRSLGTGTKEDESNTVRFWAAGFYHVTARYRLARLLKFMNHLFL